MLTPPSLRSPPKLSLPADDLSRCLGLRVVSDFCLLWTLRPTAFFSRPIFPRLLAIFSLDLVLASSLFSLASYVRFLFLIPALCAPPRA